MTKEVQNTPKKEEKLTQKNLAFVEKILVEGLSPQMAYMAVYDGVGKTTASTNAYKLMNKPLVKAELSKLSNQLKALGTVPKHMVMTKLKTFIERLEQDLDNPSNRKYFLESLDMMNKLSGHYQDNKPLGKLVINGDLSFGGWNPEEQVHLEAPSDFIEVTDGNIHQNNPSLTEPIDGIIDEKDQVEPGTEGDIEDGWDQETDMPF